MNDVDPIRVAENLISRGQNLADNEGRLTEKSAGVIGLANAQALVAIANELRDLNEKLEGAMVDLDQHGTFAIRTRS